VPTPLYVVLRCPDALVGKVRYVFDTLCMAGGIPAVYCSEPPSGALWLLYGAAKESDWPLERGVMIPHCPGAWAFLGRDSEPTEIGDADGLQIAFPHRAAGFQRAPDLPFDIVANAFFFLSSWAERVGAAKNRARHLYADSIYARMGVHQDIVDRYLDRVMALLNALCDRVGTPRWSPPEWPQGADYALVLSHDVDFLPANLGDTLKQGAKTVMRHLVKQRDPGDAARAAVGLARALIRGRDPYGCIPEIIRREKAAGVRSSFQVAVGHRHPNDVNYDVETDQTRDYLRAITDAGFDLCLHGSYRSTEKLEWYLEEIAILTRRLERPLGSRQHFLSFDYDTLFSAQERAGIQYDMSMGFPDRTGPRAGFSHPYFPYCIEQDRPYDVLQISLFLMDVTLRGYMNVKGEQAWQVIEHELQMLRRKHGCASAVWHPIVFGGARDPGYDRLFWRMIDRVRETGGLPTDGRAINEHWRERASAYASFAQPKGGSSSAKGARTKDAQELSSLWLQR
jgi:hypothetical protein